MRWTDADVDAARRRLASANHANTRINGKPKESKFKNQPTYVDNLRFASKKEATYYIQLKLAKAMGQIRGFARQVSIPLPSGKRRMIIDFVVFELDGRIRWVDTKGVITKDWAVKKDELEASLGIQIETV